MENIVYKISLRKFKSCLKNQKYEQFKSNMPDIEWLKDYMPEDAFNQMSDKMKSIYETIHPPNLVS